MLRQIFSAVLHGVFKRNEAEASKENASKSLQLAKAALMEGDVRVAMGYFESYLEFHPYDCAAINDLGFCYDAIGNVNQAAILFDRAYQLDSTFLPGISNHAKTLVDRKRSQEALSLIRMVKAQSPDSGIADFVLVTLRQGRGEIELACRHARDAWMKSFDSLRQANNYVFNSSYRDIDESLLTAEHAFWAATLAPLREEFSQQPAWMSDVIEQEAPRRIRIGYWSPDLRDHSVFFFAYPLISNHDRTVFEIFIYNDSLERQEQTDKIQMHADHFHETALLNDVDLFRLIRSHQLDVLMELAGHTSSNRLSMLQGRLARVQLTGLGYPPTTGLSTLDGKLLDVHVCPDASLDRFYAERPVRLPESFWSFDPYWTPDRIDRLPCDEKGMLTYGCFGNISKISGPILVAWVQIIREVPNSRLLIRSLSFNDPAAMDVFRKRMIDAGMPVERFELRGPAAAKNYLNAYNEVDVVLDTYPFNGGTTSCFALYMGVLVVTKYGEGLRSRMGLSMLSNLGLAHWAASSLDEYVALAVRAARCKDELREFRRNAETRFKSTALGDGRRFCRHVEAACREMLAHPVSRDAVPVVRPDVPHLPAREIMRRAYAVNRYGQHDAAQRIARYCLAVEPDYVPAHLLLMDESRVDEAVSRLQVLIHEYPGSEGSEAAQLMLTRLLLAAQRQDSLHHQLQVLLAMRQDDSHDQTFSFMLTRWLSCLLDRTDLQVPVPVGSLRQEWTLIVEAPDRAEFDYFVSEFRESFPLSLSSIQFEFCCSTRLAHDLSAALSRCERGYVALTQSNLRLASLQALDESAASLEDCDLVSYGGCVAWDRILWRRTGFANKVMSVISPSKMGNCRYEVRKSGQSCERRVGGLALLDGGWIAFHSDLIRQLDPGLLEFSMELDGAAGLMFEEWSHRIQRRGYRLMASQALGLVILDERPVCRMHSGPAMLYLTELYGFDPLAELEEDHAVFGVPVVNVESAQYAQSVIFGGGGIFCSGLGTRYHEISLGDVISEFH